MKSYQAPASPFDWNANEAVDPEVFRTKKWWDETQNKKLEEKKTKKLKIHSSLRVTALDSEFPSES